MNYITENKKIEDKLCGLTRAMKALGASRQATMHASDEEDYLKKICDIIVKNCGYCAVAIVYAEQDEGKTVRPAAYVGFDEEYMKAIDTTWSDSESGRGPTGTAIRTGKMSICSNILTDPDFHLWRDQAAKRGYASCIAIPLVSHGKAFGAITIYSGTPDRFPESEINLITDIANDAAYGVIAIRSLAQNMRAEDILKRDKETLAKLVREQTKALFDAHMELEKVKRLSDLGVLATTVAHELRNPLAAISLAASNIKRKAAGIPIERHLQTIDKKIAESDQIINNLLYYSRIRPPHKEKVRVAAILEECMGHAHKQSKKKISVEKDLDALKDVSIEADPLQIQEVCQNILSNAYDAVEDSKGMIRIGSEVDDGYVRIYVKDNGSGISKDDLAKVFDPFFTTKAKGTGLGLSVCQQIIHMHGGSIGVESEPGNGTSVMIALPMERKR